MEVGNDHMGGRHESRMDEHQASAHCKNTLKAADQEAVRGPMDTHDHEEIKTVVPQTPHSDCSTHNIPEAGVARLNGTKKDVPGTVKTGANQAGVACSSGDTYMEHTDCPGTLNRDAIKSGGDEDGNGKGSLVNGQGTSQGVVKDKMCNIKCSENGDLSIIPVIENDTAVSVHSLMEQNDCKEISDAGKGLLHNENSPRVAEPVNRGPNDQGDHTKTMQNSNTTGHNDHATHNGVRVLKTDEESNQVYMVSTATQTSSSQSVQTQTNPSHLRCNPRGRGVLVPQQNVDSEPVVSDIKKPMPEAPVCQDAATNVSQYDLNGIISGPQQGHVNKGIIKSQDSLNVPTVNEKPYLSRCLNCGSLQRVHPWTRNVSFSLGTDTQSSDESSTRTPPNHQQHNGDVLPIADDVIVTSSSVDDDRIELVESRLNRSRAPRDHLCLAVFGCLLSPLTGPCAIRYAVKSRRSKAAGDYRKASHNGQKALVLTIIGICLTVVVVGSTLYLLYYYLIPET